MVNNLATLKCNCKLAICNACREFFKLYKPALTRGQIGNNRDIMQDIYPLWFHCDHPRNCTGHYQAEILAMAIAMALFYGENSPSVLFHEFFNPIPIPTLAFILTMIEFCLSEWTTGNHVPRDLKSVGKDGLLNMYLSHMENLRLYCTIDGANLSDL
ncbi:hypothetical protein FRC09_014612 [Ceratobasidium sp. 395]|nr:hypothetical protein FRC09_014612 [Ceratobasidium sp. 395]